MMTKTTEHLVQAAHSARFARGDLQGALSAAGPVAGLILIDLIGQAAELESKITNLRRALEEQGAPK